MRSKVVRLLPIREKRVRQVLRHREYFGDGIFKGQKVKMPDRERWLGEKEKFYAFEMFMCGALNQSDEEMERDFRTFSETEQEQIAHTQTIMKWCSEWAEYLARHTDCAQMVLRRISVIHERLWGREAVEAALAEDREFRLEQARAAEARRRLDAQ